METTMQPVKEFFTVSVDVAGGVTFVNGTTLGKQFLLENLSRMAKTNIFSAFLAFCREKRIDSKIVAMKESLSNSKPSADSKSPKTMKVLFPEETVFGSKQVTPDISSRETTGKKATGSGNETHQHDAADYKRKSTDSSDLESNVTNADIVSNGWSLQKENQTIFSQELEDIGQLTEDVKPEVDFEMDISECGNIAGNGEITTGQKDHSRNETETNTDNSDVNDQHQEAKNNITTETVDSPSTEVIDSIVIKQEPDWDDQEEGVGVNDEDMHGSLQGYEENNEDGLNSSDEEEIDENNEMLNESEAERKVTGDISQTGVYTVGNNMFLLPKHGSLISLNSKESRILKAKTTGEETQAAKHQLQAVREMDEDTGADNSARKKIPNYQLQFRHPKTGKFCSYKKLKRIENLRNSWKKRQKQSQENEKDLGSSDGVKERNQDEEKEDNRNRVQTVYFVHKVCTEWNCHCGQKFSSLPEFAEHDKEYHNTKLKLCEYCGQFMKRAKYRYHVKSHLPVVKNYQCSLCEKKYVNRLGLKKHMEFTHDGKRLICDECGKEFKAWASLYRHQLTHQNILNHLCTFCGKKFVTNYGMMSHMRVHTGEKPFSCEYCGLKFNHNVSRRNHIKKAHPGCEIHDSGRGTHQDSDAV